MVDALVKVYVEGGLVQTRRDSRVLNIGSESLMAYVGMVVGAGRRIAVKALEMKLRKARATSASNAVAPEEAGITSERELGWIDHLVKQDKIVKTEDGKIRWKE